MSLDQLRYENAFFRSQRRVNKRQANEDRKAATVLPTSKAQEAANNSYFSRSRAAASAGAQRQQNVARAMANGSFAQTRFAFNQENAGRASMDGAGNITQGQARKREVQFMPGPGGSMVPVKRQRADVFPKRPMPQKAATPAPAPILGPRNSLEKANPLDLKPVGDPGLRAQIETIKARQAKGNFDGSQDTKTPAPSAAQPPTSTENRSPDVFKRQPGPILTAQTKAALSAWNSSKFPRKTTPSSTPAQVVSAASPRAATAETKAAPAAPPKSTAIPPPQESEQQKMARLQADAEKERLANRSDFQKIVQNPEVRATFAGAAKGLSPVAALPDVGRALNQSLPKVQTGVRVATNVGRAVLNPVFETGRNIGAFFRPRGGPTPAANALAAAQAAQQRAKRGPVYIPPTVQPGLKPQQDEEKRRLAGL